MASSTLHTVTLSPLDQYMPRIYTNLFLVFETPDPALAVDRLRAGLQKLNQHLPYLKGRVFVADRARLAIRWSAADEDVKLQETHTNGVALPGMSFKQLSQEGAPPHYFKPCLTPLPRVTDFASNPEASVFAANFTLLDGGLVVGLSIQHNVIDGTGVAELIRFWADCASTSSTQLNAAAAPDPEEPLHRDRLLRLATEQTTPEVEKEEPQPQTPSLHGLLAKHPEFTLSATTTSSPHPPTPPLLPKGTSKIFTFSTSKLAKAKASLLTLTPQTTTITTNSVLCAITWSCITRIRLGRRQREGGGHDQETHSQSKLGFAINGRTRLPPQFLMERPFLGNVNLYGLAEIRLEDLERAANGDVDSLAAVVQAIDDAVGRVTPAHIGEVIQLVDRVPDTRGLLPGWNSVHGDDATVTSWANMGVYDADFGEAVGAPRFMRVPESETDGFLIVLPRQRGPAERGIEVVAAMHPEDMKALERDVVWGSYLV
ncbi:trichothecene 3-O-acetyltransferase [Achaetomium macrosporum]|uniref:Trichothecene 3-O-acetyltransferase n=1 Tax=Achaetomium macrosporum TaxID=79813 RepID=A0AAN7HGC5_9PEZI|nr:trichothecene 3-O-acetyltransferase [Achaetomium macrosporum]